jgi:hypothetical protein
MSFAVRSYTLLLRLYPAPHRSLLGPEMSALFRERLAGGEVSGFGKRARFVASECAGTLADIAVAWSSRIRHAAGHDEGCGCLPDFRKMRPPWTEAKSYYRLFRAPRP